MAPAQTGEPGVVAIRRDPFRCGLDCKRGKVGVTHQIAFGPNLLAQASENAPVELARRHYGTTRVLTQLIREFKG